METDNRFRFRAWVPVFYYDEDGCEHETMMRIDNVAVYSDGAIGCSENDLDSAVINLELSESEEQSVRDYIEANFSTESDLWYFFDISTAIKEQCTGLSDKIGNLIYEGDIVKCDRDFRPDGRVGLTRQVVWEDSAFMLAANGDSYYLGGFHNIEIIGNIHEHKE